MSKQQPIKLAAIFSGVRSRKDKSYSLNFDTRELAGEDAAKLLGLHQTEGWLLFAPSDRDIAEQDIPDEKPDASVGQKSQSQRLRAVIYRWWEQLGKPGDFESFYRTKTELLIDIVKEKLNP